ncbi:MAG: hypothetical protein ACE5GL_04320 [Calditrichia bacterium]
MNSTITVNILRFIVLVLLQGLVLVNVGSGWVQFPYFNVFLYPIFIFLLPIRTPKPLVIFSGFVLGLTVDLFYLSPGVHAAAAVFTAFIRPAVLKYLQPGGGYKPSHSPTKASQGLAWYVKYSAILLLPHLLIYFFVEAFSFVYWDEILLKTLFSFVISMVFIIMHQLIIRPAE